MSRVTQGCQLQSRRFNTLCILDRPGLLYLQLGCAALMVTFLGNVHVSDYVMGESGCTLTVLDVADALQGRYALISGKSWNLVTALFVVINLEKSQQLGDTIHGNIFAGKKYHKIHELWLVSANFFPMLRESLRYLVLIHISAPLSTDSYCMYHGTGRDKYEKLAPCAFTFFPHEIVFFSPKHKRLPRRKCFLIPRCLNSLLIQ